MIPYLVCIFLPLSGGMLILGEQKRQCDARALLKVSSVFGILSKTETKITKTTRYVRLFG